MRGRRRRRRSTAPRSASYVLNYTVGNVAKRTGETREAVREWLKARLKKLGDCPFCGVKLTLGTFAVDHMESIASGGSPLLSNCHLTCPPCNRAKGDLNVGEFSALLAFFNTQSSHMKKSVLARLKIAGALYRGR